MELKDKVVFITGSSDGIGKLTALNFAKEGANVVVTYNTNKKSGEKVFEECNKLAESFLVHLNITDDVSIKKAVEETIDKFGAIDILVNNAGVVVWKNFIEQSGEEIENQIDVNLNGLIKMTKAVLPYIQGQDDGIVINISSGAGKHGHGGLSVYSATKFAIRGITQSLAEEYSKDLGRKIKFYSVNPRMTATKMTNFQGMPPEKVAEVIVNTAKENLGKNSGDDVDVEDYV